MESNDEVKGTDIRNRTCCYFNNIMRVADIKFYKTSLEEKSYENILIYDISYKTFMCAKQVHIRFNKIDGFIKIYDGTRYLVLFGPERYDAIYDWIKYITREKSGITYVIGNNFARIKVDSYDSVPLQ